MATHTREHEKLVCDLCENEIDTLLGKCIECDVYMCESCTKAHTKITLTKDHRIIFDHQGTARPKSKCSIHTGEDVIYFCETCEILICSDCILVKHQTHKCTKIKDTVKEREQKLSRTLHTFKESQIPLLKSMLKYVETLQNDNAIHSRKTEKVIIRRTGEILAEAQKAGDDLLRENQMIADQNAKYLERVHTGLSKDLSIIEILYNDFQKLLNTGSDIEKITAEKKAREQFVKSSYLDIVVQFPTFIVGTTDAALLRHAIGSLDTGEQGSDFDSNNGKQIGTNSNGSESESAIGVEVENITEFNYKSTKITSICPVSETLILTHCEDEYENRVITNNGHVQQTIKLDFKASDFAVTANGIILACNLKNKCICKFTMDGKKINKFSTAPLYPVCLCLARDGNILVTVLDSASYTLSDRSRRHVSRLSNNGKTIQTYEYNNGERLFTKPTGIDENTNGDICVVNKTSNNSGQLVILKQNGELKIIYKGGPKDQAFFPVRVKCDKVGYIIVSDWYKKIHLLGMDGQLIKYLMTEKEWKERPCGIAIDFSGLLWVGCWDCKMYVIKYRK